MTKIFLGLGSNMGDKTTHIKTAVKLLHEKIFNIEQASLYISQPWGVTEQPDFINTGIMGETRLEPEELLDFVKDVEKRVGRQESFRWGPREIDVDIIFYGDTIFKSKKLNIPHIGAHERDTVLVPLHDLDPEFIHPVFKKTVRQLLEIIPANKRSVMDTLTTE